MQVPSEAKPDGAVPEAILHPGGRRLFGHWAELKGERPAPARQEIDLRALAPILPWIGIIEAHASARRFRWRLAGTGLARLWGGGLTGSEVAAQWPDIYRSSLLRALGSVCDGPQPFAARLKAVSAHGEALGLELTAVPVAAADGGPLQILCAVLPFREPSWLGHVAVVCMELSKIVAIWTDPVPDPGQIARTCSLQPVRLRLLQGGLSD